MKKIKKNFLVVSNYNNDLDWVKEYSHRYFVYDKSESDKFIKNLDIMKVKKVANFGYNLADYFTFIIDNYRDLPECTIFVKGNIFPRHVTQNYFDRIVNNAFFTPIEDFHMHNPEWPTAFFSSDGGYNEINNSWYLHLNGYHPTKYFEDYNEFLRFCFKDPVIPRYIRFAPGANYIVPKANVLKLPKQFYVNLRTFVSHHNLAGEAHIVERALYTLWTANFEINIQMLQPLDSDFGQKANHPPAQRSIWLKKLRRMLV